MHSSSSYPDVNGVVVEKHADLGDYLKRGDVLYEVADLRQLWIMFDLYESDLANTRKGDTIHFTVRSIPGKMYKGRITFIDPRRGSRYARSACSR